MSDWKCCRRGEVWFFTMVNNYGRELLTGRPCVVLSDSSVEDPMVTIMFLTTTVKDFGVGVELHTPKKKSYALPSQIQSYDKDRLRQYMCTLTEEEMSDIEGAMIERLGLTVEKEVVPIKVDEDDKISELEEQIVQQKVTIEAIKKLYEKALELYCEVKLQADVASKVEPKVEPKPEIIDEPIDLSALQAKFNVSDERLKKNKVENKVENKVDGRTALRGKPRIGEWISGEKVNVNTATVDDLVEKAGIGRNTSAAIIAYRNKNGAFKDLSDLCYVRRFGKQCFDKYIERLEI